jgi:hypothetical protein
MIEKDASSTEYRGYSLVVSERSHGWCVHIFRGRQGLRHPHPLADFAGGGVTATS